jgi:hypothetical protein
VIAIALRREARMIGEQLQPEVADCVLGAGDVMVLSALHERRRLRRAARRDGGAARQACRAWVTTATDLAFLRHRVQRGLPTGSDDPAGDEANLVQRLRELRPALGPASNAVSLAAAERAARLAQVTAARAAGQPVAWTDPAAGRPATDWEAWTPLEAGSGSAARPAQPAAAQAPASWYPDPWRQARWRWWDGASWTPHVAN